MVERGNKDIFNRAQRAHKDDNFLDYGLMAGRSRQILDFYVQQPIVSDREKDCFLKGHDGFA